MHRENNKTKQPWFTPEAWTSSPSEHIYIKQWAYTRKNAAPK